MSKFLLLALLTASILSSQNKDWKDEPAEFKGVKFGSSQRFFAATVTISGANSCLAINTSTSACTAILDAGNFKITANFVYEKDALTAVVGTFPAESYSEMVEIFEAKYGTAHSKKTSAIQNRMGATFEQVKLGWAGKTMLMSLDKYGSTVDEGTFSLHTADSLKQYVEDDKAKKKDVLK